MNPERIEADCHERTTIYGYRCNFCGFILDESNGGFLYLRNDRGDRIPLRDHGEREIIAQMLRMEEESLRNCEILAASQEAIIDIMEERVGSLSACVCIDCLGQFGLDLRKDTLECPHCKSERIRTLLEMTDKRCPKCQSGHMERF
jgi:predicted Zn-ribbon and HTH transcriptional regulator